jgi:hypothetical protein
MAFVVDALVAASWAFPDEGHPMSTSALLRLSADRAQVPSLWWFEAPTARGEVPSPGRWIRPGRIRPSGAAKTTTARS